MLVYGLWDAGLDVVFFGEAAERLWNDVVNFHRRADNGLGGQAIATPMVGLRGDFLAQGFGDVSVAHALGASSETS